MNPQNQLRSFLRVLQAYGNDIPLARFLPGYFRQNKQMGSSDRRSASDLLYKYFRLGRACANLPEEERLFIAVFLCAQKEDAFLAHFKPQLNERAGMSYAEKSAWLKEQGTGFDEKDVFPFAAHFSTGLEPGKFFSSLFIQPDLFIRSHPGKEDAIAERLRSSDIPFTRTGSAFRLGNGTRLEAIFTAPYPFEVQDLSSQQTGDWFRPAPHDKWWDACAASGGKSLLLLSGEPDIRLLVSDIRESVLSNLDERFTNAGFQNYQKKEIDLTQNPDPVLHAFRFDGIILDAPCSGSGTWGRTPEMISQFSDRSISFFQSLQKSIAANVIRYLEPGKPLIYITCSVFKEENEEMVAHLVKKHGLKLESSALLKGYERKADTMFVARLLK